MDIDGYSWNFHGIFMGLHETYWDFMGFSCFPHGKKTPETMGHLLGSLMIFLGCLGLKPRRRTGSCGYYYYY